MDISGPDKNLIIPSHLFALALPATPERASVSVFFIMTQAKLADYKKHTKYQAQTATYHRATQKNESNGPGCLRRRAPWAMVVARHNPGVCHNLHLGNRDGMGEMRWILIFQSVTCYCPKCECNKSFEFR